jgi:hypothetical protein
VPAPVGACWPLMPGAPSLAVVRDSMTPAPGSPLEAVASLDVAPPDVVDQLGVRVDHDVLVVGVRARPLGPAEPGGIGTYLPLIAPQCAPQVYRGVLASA